MASVIGQLAAAFRILLFPFEPIERLDLYALDRRRIQAAYVDAVAIGVRAGNIEGFDAAHRAEKMLRGAGVERVGRQRLAALKQSESGARHDQMEITGLGAYRAIAFRRRQLGRSVHLESDAAAVTATSMKGHAHAIGEKT